MTDKFSKDEAIWIRFDEGSLGEATFLEYMDNLLHVQPKEMKTPVLLDEVQVARTREEIIEREPDLQGQELEEVITTAANVVAAHITSALQDAEFHSNVRWGEGTERSGAFMAAAYGAALGVAQGWMAGAPGGALGICDTTARTIAIHIMKERGLDGEAAKLERVQNEAKIEATVAGAPLHVDG